MLDCLPSFFWYGGYDQYDDLHTYVSLSFICSQEDVSKVIWVLPCLRIHIYFLIPCQSVNPSMLVQCTKLILSYRCITNIEEVNKQIQEIQAIKQCSFIKFS